MLRDHRGYVDLVRGRLPAAAVLFCTVLAGCASPIGSPWADFKTKRQIEKIAADESFPSAAELGMAVSDQQQDDN